MLPAHSTTLPGQRPAETQSDTPGPGRLPVRAPGCRVPAKPSHWRDHAACGRHDPRLFDPPEPGERPRAARGRARDAAAVCRGCPVTAACLHEALALGDVGIRGGVLLVRPNLSAAGPKLRSVEERQLQPCGTYAAWRRHRRAGEPSDRDCDDARAAYVARQRRTRRTAAA